MASGESVVAVAERLGHDSAALVLSIYGHCMPDSEDRTRTAIDQAWRPDHFRTAGQSQESRNPPLSRDNAADAVCVQINDRFGHETGDEVLRIVRRTLRFAARASDLVARWGGEEFLVLVVGLNADGLRTFAQRLRVLVRESRLRHDQDGIGVTVSIGATLVKPDDTARSLLRRADQLLYQSKLNGRDQVTARP